MNELATIDGPIAVTAESGEPFRGVNEEPVPGPGLPPPSLQPFGYVEEEYFLSGEVDGQAYKVSLLVRKPKDRAKFSGLIAVETIHAMGAIPFWGRRDVWLNGGHAWVAVSSQREALESQVKASNPARYTTLDIPELEARAAGIPALLRGGPQDLFSQAIMTQVGQFLKGNRSEGPFAGFDVRYLLMGGASQTGATTIRYIQQSHATARMPDGTPVWDGFLADGMFADTPFHAGGTPVMNAVSEGDFLFLSALGRSPYHMPDDADGPEERMRHYQFAGPAHIGTRGITDPKTIFPTLADAAGPGERLSQFPLTTLYDSAARNLLDWVMKGTVPPRADRFEIKDSELVRDEHGNVKGGVRLPYVDVPTVRYIAAASLDPTQFMRMVIGLEVPFDAAKLTDLYGSRDAYLAQFRQGIDKAVAGRWITADAGEKLKSEEVANAPSF